MKAVVSKWGNSLAIRLPKAAVERLRVREGLTVELEMQGDSLVIQSPRPRYCLDDLVAQMGHHPEPEAIEFAPVGNESL